MTEQIDQLGEAIERATDGDYSRQPRFQPASSSAWLSTYRWLSECEIKLPDYSSDSRARDAVLRAIWRQEPHLAGVVNSVTTIDKNRGWQLVGGRNQVSRYTRILHAADTQGWRRFMAKSSLSYWATDMGCVSECGRDGRGGPLRALYHVDSARCRLTGDSALPLEYHPKQGGQQKWPVDGFFRVASMPSDDEAFNDLGFCAVSRIVEVVRVLHAVLVHDQEQLAARAPRGLLLLHGISEEQWNDAMHAREVALDGENRRYYNLLAVLASSGIEQVEAKLVALSQLPAGFDEQTFTDLAMATYALCFGYDPREFWPMSQGTLGTGRESEVQAVKATGKGGLDFVLGFQEQLQLELPETLLFQFEQRDDAGELAEAATQKAKLDVISRAYETGLMQGVPLVSREEARVLLAEAGLIPEEWTATEEDVTATDTEDAGEEEEPAEGADQGAERWLDLAHVQRAMAQYPREQIVRYTWPAMTTRVLWSPRNTPRFHAVVRREEGDVLYQSGDVIITQEDQDRAVEEARRRVGPELAELLAAPTLTPEQLAALDGGA